MLVRALVLVAVSLITAASAQPARVPGTRVALAPPAGWAPATSFAGFQNEALSASVVVLELAGAPLAELVETMTPEVLRAQGFTDAELERVEAWGTPSLLIRGSQRAYGTAFAKWVLLTGDAAGAVLVTASVPEEHAAALGPAIEEALLSVARSETAPADLFEGLGFSLDLPDALGHRQRAGATLALAAEPTPSPPGAPLYVVGLGAAPLARDLAAAADGRIRRTAGVHDVGAVRGREITVDGRPAYQALADGADSADGTPVVVYLVLVPDGAGYVIAQGIVGADRADEWVPRFREITGSLRWRDE